MLKILRRLLCFQFRKMLVKWNKLICFIICFIGAFVAVVLLLITGQMFSTGPLLNKYSLSMAARFLPHGAKFRSVFPPAPAPASSLHRRGQSKKRILLWTKFFGTNWPNLLGGGANYFEKRGCRQSGCEFTTDHSLATTAEALIFHIRDINHGQLPGGNSPHLTTNQSGLRRRAEQRYVFFLHESPAYTRRDLAKLAGYFNWTMTYRLDSDIVMTYGYLSKQQAYDERKNYAKGKDKLVAWFVSNCDTQSNRHVYAKKLSKYIPVDVYGKCGKLKCGKQRDSLCFDMVVKRYKFYLAFENSLCQDYVSEKFFRVITRDIVLVVLGGADYSKIVPRSAYIDVKDYRSPRHLARHLKKLHRDHTLYNEYFAWRRNYTGFLDGYDPYCRLCEKLYNDSAAKSYADIHDWWITQAHCHTVKVKANI